MFFLWPYCCYPRSECNRFPLSTRVQALVHDPSITTPLREVHKGLDLISSAIDKPAAEEKRRAIARLLTSAYGSTTTPSSPLKGWSSSSSTPRNSAMMAGQIIDRAPRTRTNMITANGSWTS